MVDNNYTRELPLNKKSDYSIFLMTVVFGQPTGLQIRTVDQLIKKKIFLRLDEQVGAREWVDWAWVLAKLPPCGLFKKNF